MSTIWSAWNKGELTSKMYQKYPGRNIYWECSIICTDHRGSGNPADALFFRQNL